MHNLQFCLTLNLKYTLNHFLLVNCWGCAQSLLKQSKEKRLSRVYDAGKYPLFALIYIQHFWMCLTLVTSEDLLILKVIILCHVLSLLL